MGSRPTNVDGLGVDDSAQRVGQRTDLLCIIKTVLAASNSRNFFSIGIDNAAKLVHLLRGYVKLYNKLSHSLFRLSFIALSSFVLPVSPKLPPHFTNGQLRPPQEIDLPKTANLRFEVPVCRIPWKYWRCRLAI